VAIPDGFRGSPGSDQEVVLRYHGPAHRGTYRFCEFWGFHWEDAAGTAYEVDDGTRTPVARAGGCDNYRNSATRTATKWWPYPLGVQASGARFLPGIVTAEDWTSGVIDHEVDIVVPEACGTFRAPAVRTDGWGTPAENPACLEYGTLYRLPAGTDCNPTGWWGGPGNARAAVLVCRAARRYGLRITDRNLCCVTVRYENVLSRLGVDPFGLSWDDRMLRWYFPWADLQVDGAIFALLCAFVLVVIVGVIVGLFSGYKVWHRAQQRADANNRVKVTAINIRNAEQQAKVVAAQDATVKAQADQRLIAARGIRNAQDEIAKTLTPLYVQFEAVQAQLAMAKSQNHTIVYVPAGTNGTPVITQDATASDAPSDTGK
jgi:hypothetical protein